MFTRERLTRWTKFLRENPKLQGAGSLISLNGKMCCLGALCFVEGLPIATPRGQGFILDGELGDTELFGKLEQDFGSATGNFFDLGMRDLQGYRSAASANDFGISWLKIADHFDKFYPCSDEEKLPLSK
jgi:hypothetical protein